MAKLKKHTLILTYDSGEPEYNVMNDWVNTKLVFWALKNLSAASNWEYKISFAISPALVKLYRTQAAGDIDTTDNVESYKKDSPEVDS
jgi:hypothetical protein